MSGVEDQNDFTDNSEVTVLIDEAGSYQADVDFYIEDAARIVDTERRMRELADAIDTNEEIGERSKRLIETIGRMAVTGTVLPSSTFIPTFESRFNTGMEMASYIRDAAKKLWEQISKLLKMIWEKIVLLYRKMFGAVTMLKRDIKSLRSQLKERTDVLQPNNRTFELSTGLNKLSVDGKVLTNGSSLKSAYQTLFTYVQWGCELRAKEIADQGEILVDILETFTDNFPTVANSNVIGTDRIINQLDTIFKGCNKAPNSQRVVAADSDAFRSRPILGGFTIVETAPKSDSALFLSDLDVEDLNRLEKDKVRLIARRLHNLERTRTSLRMINSDIPYAVDFTTMKRRDIEDILDYADEVLSVIDKFMSKGGSKSLEIVSDKLKNSSDRCAKAWDTYVSENEGKIHQADHANVNAFLAIDLTFTRWTKEPVTSLIDEALKVTRAVMMVAGKSINQYERK